MTDKLRQAMKLALDVLEGSYAVHPDEAITALREALAEQVNQNPIGWTVASNFVDDGYGHSFTVVSSEPANTTSEPYIPIYAAPVRTKDLTDDEIAEVIGWALDEFYLADFRAVIAADREKNK